MDNSGHLWTVDVSGFWWILGVSRCSKLRPWPSKGSKFFLVTFGLSLLWIGSLTFLLVWLTDTASRRHSVEQLIFRLFRFSSRFTLHSVTLN